MTMKIYNVFEDYIDGGRETYGVFTDARIAERFCDALNEGRQRPDVYVEEHDVLDTAPEVRVTWLLRAFKRGDGWETIDRDIHSNPRYRPDRRVWIAGYSGAEPPANEVVVRIEGEGASLVVQGPSRDAVIAEFRRQIGRKR